MKLRARLSLLLFLLALPLRAEEVKRSFPVQPGCTLKLESHRGGVTIVETEASEISVTVQIDVSAASASRAKVLRDALELKLEPAENGAKIFARDRRAVRIHLGDDDALDLIFQITVPRQCNVDLIVRDGSITVGNLAGRMTARVETGNIFFRRIEGSVEAEAEVGSVIVSRCSGAVTAKVMRGLIRVGTIGGNLQLRNTSGDIEVMTAKAAVVAHADVGTVTVGFAAPIQADSRITTSGGSIVAQIAATADCRIDASSVWGKVDARIPLVAESGGSGKRKLAGRLNQGGPRLVLQADGGDVLLTRDLTVIDDDGAANGEEAALPDFSDEKRDSSPLLRPKAGRAEGKPR